MLIVVNLHALNASCLYEFWSSVSISIRYYSHTDFIHCLPIIQTTNTMDPKKNLTNNPGVANTPAQPNATNANSSNPNQLSGTASAALSDMAKASPQLALQCQ